MDQDTSIVSCGKVPLPYSLVYNVSSQLSYDLLSYDKAKHNADTLLLLSVGSTQIRQFLLSESDIS